MNEKCYLLCSTRTVPARSRWGTGDGVYVSPCTKAPHCRARLKGIFQIPERI